ncbi:MAG: aminoacyl-tRNA hydrolase [Terriglobia bacterium]
MKLIFGLGNPGPEYELSPHNLGFGVVERLAERHSVRVTRKQGRSLCGRFAWEDREIWLIKPQTFMNQSGLAVRDWMTKQECGPSDILVIADELDLPWGQLRIRQQGGAAGHHGLESVIESLGTKQFARLRIGVRPERPVADSVRYLLSPVGRARRGELDAVLDRAADAVDAILQVGAARAMTLFNRRDPLADDEPPQRAPSAVNTKEATN